MSKVYCNSYSCYHSLNGRCLKPEITLVVNPEYAFSMVCKNYKKYKKRGD